MAAYAAILVRQRGGEPTGPPTFWFAKLALTGLGGLREVRALLETAET